MITLKKIADELEMAMDDWQQFYNKKTEEFVSLPDSANYYVDREDEDEELAKEIDSTDNYVRLPGQYKIHEYRIMEAFAESLTNQNHQQKLFRILNGSKIYRHFKDAIKYLGISDAYYKWRFQALCEIFVAKIKDYIMSAFCS
jgi:hypothetical protein